MSFTRPHADLVSTLSAQLLRQPDHESRRRSDYDLNPGYTDRSESLRPAAVLVPIILHRSAPSVLFTRRAVEMNVHAGQISFPGGRVDDGDRNAADTALRETAEEIGLERDQIRIAGFLDNYESRTGYLITPAVGLVAPEAQFRLNPYEVEEVFEVPLSYLMEPDNYQTHDIEWEGAKRYFYAVTYGNYYIWGVTAGVLKSLFDRLADS